MAHSPPMPMPARKRNKASCHTESEKYAAPVKTAYISTVPASVLVRPNLSAIGPQMNEKPHPTRKSAKRIEP